MALQSCLPYRFTFEPGWTLLIMGDWRWEGLYSWCSLQVSQKSITDSRVTSGDRDFDTMGLLCLINWGKYAETHALSTAMCGTTKQILYAGKHYVWEHSCEDYCLLGCDAVGQWWATFWAHGPNQEKKVFACYIINSTFFFLCIINDNVLSSVVPIPEL